MQKYALPLILGILFIALMVFLVACTDNGEAPVDGCTLVDDTTSVCGDTQYKFY